MPQTISMPRRYSYALSDKSIGAVLVETGRKWRAALEALMLEKVAQKGLQLSRQAQDRAPSGNHATRSRIQSSCS
jgi:hypothetical protein